MTSAPGWQATVFDSTRDLRRVLARRRGTIRRLELTSITDAAGVAWDDFAFDTVE